MSQTCTVDREKNLTNLNIKKSKPAITIYVSVNRIIFTDKKKPRPYINSDSYLSRVFVRGCDRFDMLLEFLFQFIFISCLIVFCSNNKSFHNLQTKSIQIQPLQFYNLIIKALTINMQKKSIMHSWMDYYVRSRYLHVQGELELPPLELHQDY